MEKKSNNLEIRKLLKAKKPKFLRQDGHKKLRLGNKWRRPKGIQNKVRLNIRGYRKRITVGYKSPADVRGFHRTGLEMIKISSIKELKTLNPKTQGAVISNTVGQKKKLAICEEAKKLNIKILNIKSEDFIKNVKEKLEKKKEAKEKAMKDKEKKEAEKKKKAEEKAKKEKDEAAEKSIEDKLDEKEEKNQEKKEKDKILTQKT